MARLYNRGAGRWFFVGWALFYLPTSVLFRIRWKHQERLPTTGPAIVAINHLSHVDTILMGRLIWDSGRLPRVLAKDTLFDLFFVGRGLRGVGAIPVRRGTADASKALVHAVDALDRGEILVIYPEGSTTKAPAHWPMQGRTGVARLALARPDVPVIPVAQWGAQPSTRRRWLPRRKTVTATFGEPLDLTRFHDAGYTAENLRAVTDEIMAAIRGQVAELRAEPAPLDWYLPPKKKASAA